MDVEQLKKDLVVSEGEEVRHVLAGLHAISTVWQKVRVPRRMFSYNPLIIARSLTLASLCWRSNSVLLSIPTFRSQRYRDCSQLCLPSEASHDSPLALPKKNRGGT